MRVCAQSYCVLLGHDASVDISGRTAGFFVKGNRRSLSGVGWVGVGRNTERGKWSGCNVGVKNKS